MVSIEQLVRRYRQDGRRYVGKGCISVLIAFAVISFAGCGGGSSGSSGADESADNESLTQLEGRVTAPGGVVAQFQAPSLLRYASLFFVPSTAAEIVGLGPVADADVVLVRVNDTGEPRGDALARAKTDDDGRFEMPLADGVRASGDLMLRVIGQNDNLLRAPVVSGTVDVDPVSEFVTQTLLESGKGLASVDTEKLSALMKEVRKADIDFSDQNLDLAKVGDVLEEKLGDAIRAQVAASTTAPGPGEDFAGRYASVGIGFGFRDNTPGYTFGDFVASFISLTDGEVSASTAGDLEWRLISELWGYTTVPLTASGCCGYFDTEEEKLDETFDGSFGDDLVTRISVPAEKGSYDTSDGGKVTTVSPPRTLSLQATRNLGTSVLQSPTNEDRFYIGADGERKPDGKTLERNIEVFVRRPRAASLEDMVGTFGMISLDAYGWSSTSSSNSGTTSSLGYVVSSEMGIFAVNESGVTTYSEEPASSSSDHSGSGTLEVFTDGKMILTETESNSGVSQAIEFLVNDTFDVFVHGEVSGSKEPFTFDTLFALGVRLPEAGESSQPKLAGKSYRVFRLAVDGAASDVDRDNEESRSNVRAIETFDFDTVLTFSSNEAANISGAVETLALASEDRLEIQVGKEPFSDELEVDLGDQGRLTIDDGDADSTWAADGFINKDGSLAILRESEAQDQKGEAILGLVVLVEILPADEEKKILNN